MMRHTRFGWWLEEAGSVAPAPALDGDTTADVAIVGGGYLGLWTAWQLKQLEPEANVVVLERELCGHGPSGRNGGFASTLWDDLPILRERVGDTRALAVCRASERAVRGIGTWCDEQGVDAWYRMAGTLQIATSEAQLGDWDDLVEACRAVGAHEEAMPLTTAELQGRCASPLYLAGCYLRTGANVHPARLALGLREKALGAGIRIYERTRVLSVERDGNVVTETGKVRAGAAVLAVNSATAGFAGYRRALAVASSHMIVTEPVPDVLEELGWTGGENIHDCRTMLYYLRTTNDGRIAFGWGGGHMGLGGRLPEHREIDAGVARRLVESIRRFFPALRDRKITHAWGGPIDVSPTHLPIFGSRGRVHHGFGFTGNGVAPSYLGGEILARLALDKRDAVTGLALVEPDRKLFPPEPLRAAGGELIRAALIRRDEALEAGRRPDPVSSFVASLPRRLGLRLPR